MGNFVALVRREMGAYFTSAMAYLILATFLLACGFIFTSALADFEKARAPVNFTSTYFWLIFILTLLSPLITMRLVAEEKNTGTLETLMTAPVSETSFVMAKFVSSVLFLHYLLVVPLVGYAVIMSFYTVLDPGVIFTSYLAILLICCCIFAIGLFVSAICSNQITAGVITFVVALLLLFTSIATMNLPKDNVWRMILVRLDLLGASQDFLRGLVDSRHLVYFLSVIVFFLILSVIVVRSRRWR